VHPTTLRIMDELGFVDEFLRLPHTKITRVAFDADGTLRTFGNFSALKRLGFNQPYIALMPQWDFLDFLAEKASAYPEFTLIRNAEVKELIFDGDRVAGGGPPGLGGACARRSWRCMPSWWSARTGASPPCGRPPA
jgi:2-polyprenyl-6-methoxyphenol hydroxylase-like FAD-dependent oxidoreductase